MELNLSQTLMLSFINAIDGKRGKSTVISYLLGLRSLKMLRLKEETGLESYYGILSRHSRGELNEYLETFLEDDCLIVKEERFGPQVYPLLFVTEKGKALLAKELSEKYDILEDLLKANALIAGNFILPPRQFKAIPKPETEPEKLQAVAN